MKECISREAAINALREYNRDAFHIQHALTVEGVMRCYAENLGYGEDADFWATVGLLHDIDFEMWPEEHCVKAPELLKKAGCSDEFIRLWNERSRVRSCGQYRGGGRDCN